MKQNRIALFALLAATNALTAFDAQSAPALPPGLYPISGLSTSLPDRDLGPVRGLIADSEIVALGESVHTSGGFYQAKFRLIKYLVERAGFRAVAFETPWAAAFSATQYVATCQGRATEAVRGLFGVWQATSVVEMLEWLCEFNRNHPQDPVRFYGFDIQQPADAASHLRGFFQRAAPGDGARLMSAVSHCFGVRYGSENEFHESLEYQRFLRGQPLSQADHDRCRRGLTQLSEYLRLNGKALAERTSRRELDWAGLAYYSIFSYQFTSYWMYRNDAASFEARDVGMAYTFRGIRDLEFPGAKTIIWAHDAHISRHYDRVFRKDRPYQSHRSMGSYLNDIYGERYAPIGVMGYRVEINWGNFQNPPIPTHPDSLALRLHALGEKYLFVDTRSPFIEQNRPYELGEWGMWGLLAEQFRGILFLDHSFPMTYSDR